uniref:Uncharacterized protein n=1 Tax=Arundo donax TaxID=35708 RepID=A0A0A9CC51_ARUDO
MNQKMHLHQFSQGSSIHYSMGCLSSVFPRIHQWDQSRLQWYYGLLKYQLWLYLDHSEAVHRHHPSSGTQ